LFFFTLLPLRVLKCDHLTGQCNWWLPDDMKASRSKMNSRGETKGDANKDLDGKDIGALRGGSAAIIMHTLRQDEEGRKHNSCTADNDQGGGDFGCAGHIAVGFGHATLSSAQHCAFLYTVDMRNLEMRLAFQPPSELTTPFSGFSYMDPTSFWQESEEVVESKLEVDVTEKNTALPEKKAILLTRTYVACTLRVAPDYLSFDPSHHQTVIFEASSALLSPLLKTKAIFQHGEDLGDGNFKPTENVNMLQFSDTTFDEHSRTVDVRDAEHWI